MSVTSIKDKVEQARKLDSITRPQIYDQTISYDDVLSIAPWEAFEYCDKAWSFEQIRQTRVQPTVYLVRSILASSLLAPQWSVEVEPMKMWSEELISRLAASGHTIDGIKRYVEDHILPLRKYYDAAVFGVLDYGFSCFEKQMKWCNKSRVWSVSSLKNLIPQETLINVFPDTGDFAGFRSFTQYKGGGLSQSGLTGDQYHSLWANLHTAVFNDKGIFEYQGVWVDIPAHKSVLFNIDVEGQNHYGKSCIARAIYPVQQWMKLVADIQKYYGRAAGDRAILRYPVGKSILKGKEVDNREIAIQCARELENNRIIVMPSRAKTTLETQISGDVNEIGVQDWGVEAINWGVNLPQGEYGNMITYWDSQIVRVLGVPERAVLEAQFGTRSEAERHTESFLTVMQSRQNHMINNVFNEQIVYPLLALNFDSELRNVIHVASAPVTDSALSFLRGLYTQFTATQAGAKYEVPNIDWTSVRTRLDVPSNLDNSVELTHDMVAADEQAKFKQQMQFKVGQPGMPGGIFPPQGGAEDNGEGNKSGHPSPQGRGSGQRGPKDTIDGKTEQRKEDKENSRHKPEEGVVQQWS